MVISCSNCGWDLTGTEVRCPSCFMELSSPAPRRSAGARPSDGGRSPAGGARDRGSSSGVLVRNLSGRIVNAPSVLPASRPVGLLLAAAIACLLLLPILWQALLPLLVLLLLPLILLTMLTRGSAVSALGCLGSLVRPHRASEPRPGGITFRLRSPGERLSEVRFGGRPPRVELGDDVDVTGVRLGSVVHVLQLRNATNGERRVSRLMGTTVLLAVLALLAIASAVGPR